MTIGTGIELSAQLAATSESTNAVTAQLSPSDAVTVHVDFKFSIRLTRSYRCFDTIAIMNAQQSLFAFAFALPVVFTGSPVSVHIRHTSGKGQLRESGKDLAAFQLIQVAFSGVTSAIAVD